MALRRDTITPIKQINFQTVRFWLFTALLVAAPLSKYPSVATPLYNFTSFRIGLYPVLSLLFVLVSLPSLLKSILKLYEQSKTALISSCLLALVCLLGLITALYKSRSTLLVASVLLLLSLLISAWWYVAYELPTSKYKLLLKAVLIAGCVYGVVGLLQFVLAGFGHETFGLLCKNCGAQIFGFPRVNGFAAEPQFFANAMMIYFFVGLGAFYKTRSGLALSSTVLSLLAIGLTFSRGAFLAVGLSTILFFALLRLQDQVRLKTLAKHFAVLIAACLVISALFVGAASYRYRGTPDIAYKTFRSMVQQASVGLIKLPASKSETGDFTPAGFIEASGQERLDAANLSLKAWSYNGYTRLFGVGTGNLGPFVVKNISPSAPNNLTVYIFYVLLLSELGLIGAGAFVVLHVSILKSYIKRFWRHKYTAIYTGLFCLGVAFLIQYFFFGSYINVPYIWLWFGILIGSKPLLRRKAVKAL